jgi:hypothetical protein
MMAQADGPSAGGAAEREPGDEAVVRALLRHAGLSPQESEIAAITAAYPQVLRMTRSLYEVPGADSEVPATAFDARWPADG